VRIKFHAIFVLLFVLLIPYAKAGWSALKSGYAVTTDCHGLDVTSGTLVTATAGTIDSSIVSVTFVWKFPNETVAFEDVDVAVWNNGTKYPDENGDIVLYAQSSYTLTIEGEWGVQAFFKGPGGHLRGNGTDMIAIRATSPGVIPEFSSMGAVGTVVAVSLLLTLLHNKRKKQD